MSLAARCWPCVQAELRNEARDFFTCRTTGEPALMRCADYLPDPAFCDECENDDRPIQAAE